MPRKVARDAILQALAHYDPESASACVEGLAVTLLALRESGAPEFEDQVLSWMPTGDLKLLILAWHFQEGEPLLDQWSTTLPKALKLSPPWPSWSYPGPLEEIRKDTIWCQMSLVDCRLPLYWHFSLYLIINDMMSFYISFIIIYHLMI